MTRGEQQKPERNSCLNRMVRWQLGLPMFEMFWALLIFVGIGVALLPFIKWIPFTRRQSEVATYLGSRVFCSTS
jgi:hypothetical protein